MELGFSIIGANPETISDHCPKIEQLLEDLLKIRAIEIPDRCGMASSPTPSRCVAMAACAPVNIGRFTCSFMSATFVELIEYSLMK